MPNTAIPNHTLIGTEQVFLPPGKTPHPDANGIPEDGKTVARYGDKVTIVSVFEDWNGVSGLTMTYVHVPSTGYHTHFSLRELGLED
jgi:hypothetical protein